MKKLILPINNADDVMSLIPQKPPMVMVDKLLAYSENSLCAGLTVQNENIFAHNGYLSESGLVEHLAQSVALHTGYQFHLKGFPAPTGYIGSIKQIRIEERPSVGESITTEVRVLQEFMGVTLVEIESSLNGKIIAQAQMKTVIASE